MPFPWPTGIKFRLAQPYLLALSAGGLFSLLKAGINGQVVAAYGPSVSLYAAFDLFLAVSVLGGCLLAGRLWSGLSSGAGRLACFVAVALPLPLSFFPAPAGAWGAGVLTDCFLKCLFFYGPYFAVLAAVTVMVSRLEERTAGAAEKDAPAPGDPSLKFLGLACLGAGAAGLVPDTALAGLAGGSLAWAYALFAGFALSCLCRAGNRPEEPAVWRWDRRVFLAGAGIAGWCLVTPYLMLIASGSAGDDPYRELFFALALCFIPVLRRYLSRLGIIVAMLGALACLVLGRDPLPSLLFLLLLQQGRRVYWLKLEGSGMNGFFSLLAAGALGGALLGGAGILWLDENLSPGVGTGVYSLALPLMWVWILLTRKGRIVYKVASEHGSYEVVDKYMGYRALLNGGVVHGAQFFEATLAPAPGFYFSPDSPAAQLLKSNRFERVALVGLGPGALCWYARPDSRWTVYELDPEIVHIAGTYFSFLAGCKAGLEIVVGDAGETLPAAPDAEFDLIILDVYTGGSIPEHLSSPEAFLKFGAKLRKGGALLVHASGHKKRLQKSLAAFAGESGLTLAEKASPVWNVVRSDWLLAGDAALVNRMRALGWKPGRDRPIAPAK